MTKLALPLIEIKIEIEIIWMSTIDLIIKSDNLREQLFWICANKRNGEHFVCIDTDCEQPLIYLTYF